MTAPETHRPADTEDRLTDHNYDGILEYDNPMPRWWLATFWVTIIFSVIYVLNVPGVGIGKGRIADYEAEMAKAAELAAATNPLAGMTGEKLAAIAGDPAQLALGKATYATTCAACHAVDGGGGIGPNLTDAYWMHGGSPMEVLTTIVNGVLDKGMPAWGKVLKPDQVQAVAAYLTTLVGTTPAKPKEPQGTMAPPGPAAPPTG